MLILANKQLVALYENVTTDTVVQVINNVDGLLYFLCFLMFSYDSSNRLRWKSTLLFPESFTPIPFVMEKPRISPLQEISLAIQFKLHIKLSIDTYVHDPLSSFLV